MRRSKAQEYESKKANRKIYVLKRTVLVREKIKGSPTDVESFEMGKLVKMSINHSERANSTRMGEIFRTDMRFVAVLQKLNFFSALLWNRAFFPYNGVIHCPIFDIPTI